MVDMDRSNSGKPSESYKKMLSKEIKLDADPEAARMFFSKFTINGVNYCRPHLLISCHLCEEDNSGCQDDCDAERERLSLRCGGDARLNERAERWKVRVTGMLLEVHMKIKDIGGMPMGLKLEMKRGERELNDEFLADVSQTFKDGASQCCYYGCEMPDAKTLSKCAGCGVVKYCCKEHQTLDWKWEHKFECTSKVPKFVLEEIESDRQRNLRGIYDNTERQMSGI